MCLCIADMFMCCVCVLQPMCLCITEPGNEINCMDFSCDGEHYITVGKDLDVRVYDTQTNKVFTKPAIQAVKQFAFGCI